MMTMKEEKELLAERLGISKADADRFVTEYVGMKVADLKETGKTKLPGIGTLEIRYRAARVGHNPATKEEIQIAESLTVGLSASKIIKEDIANNVNIENYRK